MASYSVDLRERIVRAHIEEGQSKSAVARRFGVSRGSVYRYVKRAAAGCLAATPHPGRRRRLAAEQCVVLRRQVEEHKDWTLEQHAEAFTQATGVTLKKSSVANYCRRLGVTHKKRASRPASEMNNGENATVTR